MYIAIALRQGACQFVQLMTPRFQLNAFEGKIANHRFSGVNTKWCCIEMLAQSELSLVHLQQGMIDYMADTLESS